MSRYHLTRKSSNVKTGPIPVSTSSDDTCPDTCPLKGAGCYASSGYHLAMHWGKVSSGERGGPLADLLAYIRAMDPGQIWRHNQAGDLPGKGNRIAPRQLADLASANAGRRGFTYTHKPPTPANVRAVRDANRAGFTVNWSADTLKDADALSDMGAGPVVCLLPEDSPRRVTTPRGRPVVVCPAQTRDGVTCATCGLCQRQSRTPIVGFLAHGNGKNQVSQVASSAGKV